MDASGLVRYRLDGVEHGVAVGTVLANVAPAVLARLLAAGASDATTPRAAATSTSIAPRDQRPFGDDLQPGVPPVVRERLRQLATPEGAQVKVNLLLTRLPRLRDSEVAAEAAFAGTFHINELESQLAAAYARAARGEIPSPLPCEIYCHTLSDPSILAPELAASGMHTLTVFGLHVPDRLVERFGNDELRDAPAGRGARLAELGARRADRVGHRDGCLGPPVHRDEDDARPRAGPAHARRQHLPRTAVAGRGPSRALRSQRRPNDGASRRDIRGSCSAARARCAAGR